MGLEAAVPLDEQCEEVLRRVDAWGPLDDLTLQEARALELRRKRELGASAEPVAEVRPVRIPTPSGAIDAIAYRSQQERAPGILVWLHGGGWVLGSPQLSDDQTRIIASASGCVVLSVDYRLAPENRFPAGLEDAYTASAWAAAHAEMLGADGRLAIGGDSAGGNLAAATTLLSRARGGPEFHCQALAYPVLCRDYECLSRQAYAEGYWLTNSTMEWFWNQYLTERDDAKSQYASPLLAHSLAHLPPTFLALAECDVLHDEGRAFARRLQADGVSVQVVNYRGMLHGFMACAGIVDRGRVALRDIGATVARAISGDHGSTNEGEVS